MLLRMVLHVAEDGVACCGGWVCMLLRMVWHVPEQEEDPGGLGRDG